jgi:hypothetical protein
VGAGHPAISVDRGPGQREAERIDAPRLPPRPPARPRAPVLDAPGRAQPGRAKGGQRKGDPRAVSVSEEKK